MHCILGITWDTWFNIMIMPGVIMKKTSFALAIIWSLFLFGCADDTSNDEQKNPPDCEGDACECPDGNCNTDCDDGSCNEPPNINPPKAKCGNGKIESGEVCDEGSQPTEGCIECKSITDGWSCSAENTPCTRNCGNGREDPNEACDEGKKKTAGCSDDCKTITDKWKCPAFGEACYSPECGDGIPDTDRGEQCDDGKYNVPLIFGYGEKGECFDNCTWTPYCGDGIVDEEHESCDVGDEGIDPNSEEALNGYNLCTTRCRWSRYYCGDGQRTNGENCDDGNHKDNDGCSSSCQVEPGYYCPTDGQPCEPFKCGNKFLDLGETCDDGNRNDDDGCSAACQIEDGYICLTAGEPCEKISCSSPFGTSCNDGNLTDGDGCSASCQIEPGWICPDGVHCYVAQCGDGIAVGTEECDDGNLTANDGCNAFCKIEEGYVCPPKGGKCHITVCGDGIVEGDEMCDEGTIDHPENQTDGCINCIIQPTWECKTLGAPCTQTASCGNGILEGAEECDEGTIDHPENQTDGCINCIITDSWRCPATGTACVPGKCGDGELDKGEQCDDGGRIAGDGCDPTCKHEPIFVCPKEGECKPVCGDGITMWMLPDDVREECDDGNTVSGDGCSSDCKKENGWTCTDFTNTKPPYIDIPVNYYDFINYTHTGSGDGYMSEEFINDMIAKDPECKDRVAAGRGFPDFQRWGGYGCDGMVHDTLDKDGKPVLNSINTKCTNPETYQGSPYVYNHLSCGGSYHYWYRYEPGVNKLVKSHLRLFLYDEANGVYRFDSATPCSDFACSEGATWAQTASGENMPKGNFVPINKSGYCETPGVCSSNDEGGFTTEIKTYFQYKGGEALTFQGNDDVWVFLNNKLFVDLGGMQPSRTKTGTLAKEPFGDTGKNYDKNFEVYEGGIYNVTLFNAERMMSGSSFQLSLSGFVNAGTATCASACGDGIVVGREECDIEGHTDDDIAKKAGCVNCVKTPYCPNGTREGAEECDGEEWCDENCKFTDSTCGDGIPEGHEQCDEGTNNGKPGSACAINCMTIGCTNGILEDGEECDDGNKINDDNCTNTCKRPKCGDNIIQKWMGEVCDDGINDGSYNGCGLGCSYLPPRCGDAVLQEDEGEVCDRGTNMNTGAYGLCTNDCKFAPHCGDDIRQDEFEDCDDGPENGLEGKCPENCLYSIY